MLNIVCVYNPEQYYVHTYVHRCCLIYRRGQKSHCTQGWHHYRRSSTSPFSWRTPVSPIMSVFTIAFTHPWLRKFRIVFYHLHTKGASDFTYGQSSCSIVRLSCSTSYCLLYSTKLWCCISLTNLAYHISCANILPSRFLIWLSIKFYGKPREHWAVEVLSPYAKKLDLPYIAIKCGSDQCCTKVRR